MTDEKTFLSACKFCENEFPTYEESPETFCSNSCAESSSYEDDKQSDWQSDMDKELTCSICGKPISEGLTCSNECHEDRLADLDAQSYQSIVDEENERAEADEEGEEVPDYSDDDSECSSNREEDNRAYNEMRYSEARYYVGKYC